MEDFHWFIEYSAADSQASMYSTAFYKYKPTTLFENNSNI